MLWSFCLLLLKRRDNLTFSTQWCHGIRIAFHPFSSSVILRNSNRSAFHHDLQTFEHTPVRTFLTWRGMPLCLFLCLLFMESCSSHGHSRCWNNSPDVQFLHFCFESLMCVGSIFLPRKLHNTSVNRAVHFSLVSSPPSFPEPCFARQRLGSLDTAVSAALTDVVGDLLVHFSILPHSRKNWPICAIWKQQGKRGRRRKGRRKSLPSSLSYSGRTGLFNCILIYEN